MSLFGAGYISTAITDGPGCLMLRCPDPSCSAAIGLDMIKKLANNEDKKKYNRYFIRSFVEDNRKVIVRIKFFGYLPCEPHNHLSPTPKHTQKNKIFLSVSFCYVFWKNIYCTPCVSIKFLKVFLVFFRQNGVLLLDVIMQLTI